MPAHLHNNDGQFLICLAITHMDETCAKIDFRLEFPQDYVRVLVDSQDANVSVVSKQDANKMVEKLRS